MKIVRPKRMVMRGILPGRIWGQERRGSGAHLILASCQLAEEGYKEGEAERWIYRWREARI